jgi:hypothetical protein
MLDRQADWPAFPEFDANRILKQLQNAGVLKFQRGRVTILDEAKFRDAADLDKLYLHLDPAL